MLHGHIHADTDSDFFPLLANRERILNAGVDINGFAPATLEKLIENNQLFKNCYFALQKDVLLEDLSFIAEDIASGKRVEFEIPVDLDCPEGPIYINSLHYCLPGESIRMPDLSIERSEDYFVRLKRSGEDEDGLIKPIKFVFAKAKPNYRLEVTYSNGKSQEGDMTEWIKKKCENEKQFSFKDFKVTPRYIQWNNTSIFLSFYDWHNISFFQKNARKVEKQHSNGEKHKFERKSALD